MSLNDLMSLGRRPVAPLAGFPAVRLNQTSIKANLTNPELQAKSLMELYRRVRPDILLAMMDLTVEAEAMGAPIRMPEDDNPAVAAHLVKSAADLGGLEIPNSPSGRMNVFIETLRLLKKAEAPTVGAYVIGPFTLASEFVGAENAALMTITEPGTVKALLEPAVQVITMYAKSQIDAGADLIVILEPDAMYLSAEKFRAFSAPYVGRIIKSLSAPVVLHICGDTSHLHKDMAATGAAGLSLDADVDLAKARGCVPPEIVIIGNVSPNLMLEGDANEISAACAKLLKAMKPYSNFILSSGCDLPVDTPIDNIVAMVSSAMLPVSY